MHWLLHEAQFWDKPVRQPWPNRLTTTQYWHPLQLFALQSRGSRPPSISAANFQQQWSTFGYIRWLDVVPCHPQKPRRHCLAAYNNLRLLESILSPMMSSPPITSCSCNHDISCHSYTRCGCPNDRPSTDPMHKCDDAYHRVWCGQCENYCYKVGKCDAKGLHGQEIVSVKQAREAR
jgi:hypothetical protein